MVIQRRKQRCHQATRARKRDDTIKRRPRPTATAAGVLALTPMKREPRLGPPSDSSPLLARAPSIYRCDDDDDDDNGDGDEFGGPVLVVCTAFDRSMDRSSFAASPVQSSHSFTSHEKQSIASRTADMYRVALALLLLFALTSTSVSGKKKELPSFRS